MSSCVNKNSYKKNTTHKLKFYLPSSQSNCFPQSAQFFQSSPSRRGRQGASLLNIGEGKQSIQSLKAVSRPILAGQWGRPASLPLCSRGLTKLRRHTAFTSLCPVETVISADTMQRGRTQTKRLGEEEERWRKA